MQKLLILLLVTIFLSFNNFTLPAIAAETNHGAEVFSVHCAGCHINGGNIIRRGKNLKKPALKRYGMDTIEAVTSIITNGKNNMSAYQDRLTPQEIQEVATYVLEQAQTGWR
ncbi:c-type cytochrome [Nodularia spumigena CS-584]|uniref:Cytochrome c6 n=2 Tax=Nodularia spumigena TaxID=70799 RepID=A0A2S0Q624_NODSP|nr:c-type cytochrome [Nodularia spumigena]AHJ28282.1 Cytochrome C553 (soluble cytochrome f) [Nodularia spumigena CCY9414]AVZ29782.1 cytochrome c6 [Nodularia spumigena UHCC 0039]EAW43367.1 Cytochrome c, class I [Nodularia spumigena CCY9414]EAW46209.1 Cytochrome c, class I [Nodularia spumigena CCY9414]MDB9382991.1 c-type cytochrome [Nodularia spumigena CS-584]